MCCRSQPLPGRDLRGPEPRVRGRGEGLVHIYAGASTSIVRVLQGLQTILDSARACRLFDTSPFVVMQRVGHGGIGRAKLWHFESSSAGEGTWSDMGTFGQNSGPGVIKHQDRDVRGLFQSAYPGSCLASLLAEAIVRAPIRPTDSGN